MNRKEFEAMAESWYQRTHRLREYSEDESRPVDKRSQAFRLFLEMVSRMTKVAHAYSQMTTPPPPKNFQKGAYS